jgi:hypothetical protein
MANKFILEKETEWKNGEVHKWYYVKHIDEKGDMNVVVLTKNDEERAYELFNEAVNSYVEPKREIIKEVNV